MKTNVVVGRFQTPELHEGHISLLEKAYKESDYSLIVILAVTSDTPSLKNPYQPAVRRHMIRSCNQFKVTTFATIKDYNSDHVWSHHLDNIIDSLTYQHEVKIYHSRDSIKGHYFGKYPLVSVKSKTKISSTEIRNNVIANPVNLCSKEDREIYLAGLSHGINHDDRILTREYEWTTKI
jgi:bifunctional NMN adenylyltransferase/nudix hydrolase